MAARGLSGVALRALELHGREEQKREQVAAQLGISVRQVRHYFDAAREVYGTATTRGAWARHQELEAERARRQARRRPRPPKVRKGGVAPMELFR